MERLSSFERTALLVPLAGGLVFGLGPLLLPQSMAAFTGYSGNDPLIGRLAGAATLGYAVALGFGLSEGLARPLRLLLLATLVFNLASIFACAVEIATGASRPVVFAVLVASVLITLIVAQVLRAHAEPPATRDVGQWVIVVLALLTIPAAFFGIFPLLAPQLFASLFGQNGTDAFVYRQAGAATLGYAALGIADVRSGRWNSIRLPVLAGLSFNVAAFLATLYHIVAFGQFDLLTILVAPASLLAATAAALILALRGR